MTAEILVVAPVLDRPRNARPLVESLLAATRTDWRLVFMCSPGDTAELDACQDVAVFDGVDVLVVDWSAGSADYARKINLAFELTDEPYLLLAADDLRFHAGWDVAALEVAHEFDVGVVGTNDLGNQQTVAGLHSTHPLVARCYVDRLGGVVGEPGVVYHDGYDHQFVDTELVATARARGCYAHVKTAVVEHMHPLWGKGERDATYAKGLERGAADRRLFESRRHLWARERAAA